MGLMPNMENTYSHVPRSAMAAMAASAPADASTNAGGSPGVGRLAARTSSEPPSGVHSRSSSLTNLARLPGKARAKLQNLTHSQFVRFIEDNDAQDKEENDIYRGAAAARQNPADQVFTFERWNKHRNPMRYAKHLLHMFTSRVFKQLLGPVLAVMALALSVGIYETLVSAGALPGHWPHVTLALGQGFNLTAFALSLLLVFRTNSSYDRWWEGRKLWGGVVNRTRNIVRQSLVFFREDVHLKELLARWTMAFPKVLMVHLREGMDLQAEVAHILTANEVAALVAAAHRPNFVLQVMAEAIRAARPHELARMRMDDNLTFFEDAMGSCERILRTPIPLSYTRHTSRFLLVWLILLPFTLWAAYSWFAVILSGIFAFLMFGIDEIGVQIEEPFGILPLEAAGATIERNIRELLARNYEVASLVHQQNLPVGLGDSRGKQPAGSSPAPAGGLGGTGGSAVSLIGLAAEGETEDFGEMTGASPADAAAVDAEGKLGGGARPSIIRLSATAGGAAPAASPRRVQFADDSTVIDVRSSDGGAVGARPVVISAAAPGGLDYRRQPLLLEVELASGASPLISPRDSPSSSYSSWLHD
ncbi:UPF0187 chloroplastic [Chlorella sorokiniana]|uniref:UPF0187 chloroplastic n=1 Tax=Chlorella sorokiniana TaxID=3076 RepID=A0A2P6TP10_CHLSO|nr:UPF0187 chloroplastic [Chlorella sorokiniana]|eukprot:PRW51063.1 UPF0187 chloroplastic [Chlorella sorokiniana]